MVDQVCGEPIEQHVFGRQGRSSACACGIAPTRNASEDDVCTVSVLDELRLYFGQVLYIQLNVTNPTTALHAGDPSNRWALRLGGAADPPERYILADAAFAPSADSRWTASVSVIPAFAGALLQPTVFARSCCEGARLGERLVRQWLRVFAGCPPGVSSSRSMGGRRSCPNSGARATGKFVVHRPSGSWGGGRVHVRPQDRSAGVGLEDEVALGRGRFRGRHSECGPCVRLNAFASL